ncbi:unnamed protein product, partial [marine sediment metagenome]
KEFQNKYESDLKSFDEEMIKQYFDTNYSLFYKSADIIRDELKKIGAEVRDSKDGPKIHWKK